MNYHHWKGIAYFISQNVFDDAFVLHDPSNHYPSIYDMIKSVRKHREAGESSEKSEKNNNNNVNSYRPTDEYLLTPQSLASDG